MRRDYGHYDRGMWFLKWAKDRSLAYFTNHRFLCRLGKVFSDQLIRGLSFPDIQDHVDTFQKDLIAIFSNIAQHLGIRHQTARTYSHDESAFQQVIEHRNLRSDGGR